MKISSFNPLFPLAPLPWVARFMVAMMPTFLVLAGLPYLPQLIFKTPALVFYPLFFLATYLGGFWAGLSSCISCLVYAAVVIRPKFYLPASKDYATILRSVTFFATCLLFLILIRALKKEIKKSKSALKLRDEFIDLASHELKNPITALRLSLESSKLMVQERMSNTFDNRFFKSSDRQLDRLEKLVASMMDTTLFESGQLILSAATCDLKEIIQNLLLSERYEGIIFHVKGDGHEGLWDRLRLEQVVSNLLDNAIKYGEGSQIKVSLEKSKDQVSFSVKDLGIGISFDDQKFIFERFKRIDSDNEIQGIGLGLYLAKKLVLLHNGRISVKSAKGEGSTFTVSLPT